jgi:hypothetical protein
MDLYCKSAILASIIFVWLNASNTKSFYDPCASITFQDKKIECVIYECHAGMAL